MLDNGMLLENLDKISYTLDKAYMSRLKSEYGVYFFDEKYNKEENISYEDNIRILKINRWVFNRKEKIGECFKNVLSLFADGDHTVALVINRTVNKVDTYFVIKNEGKGRNEDSISNIEMLESSLKGNFPGTAIERPEGKNNIDCIKNIFSDIDIGSISIMTNTPSRYSEDYVTQGLDKLLNGVIPKNDKENYSVIFLAESLTQENIRDIISGYEDIATAIYPFSNQQFQDGISNGITETESFSLANSNSISNAVFSTHSINIGLNGGVSNSRSNSKSNLSNWGKVATAAGMIIGTIVAPGAGTVAGAQIGSAIGTLFPTKTDTKDRGLSIGANIGYGYSKGKSKTITTGTIKSNGESSSTTNTKNESTIHNYKSYMIKGMLDKLENTIERINKSNSTGLWKYATYVIANNSKASKKIANYLCAITQGKESFIEPSSVQEWVKESVTDGKDSSFLEIEKYIKHFTHPIFYTMGEMGENMMMVTPTSYVSTNELSEVIAFPNKSVPNLPIIEGIRFGREPQSFTGLTGDLPLGCAYHMYEKIDSQVINISKNSLASHTFITGSTGTGKSNYVYSILDSLTEKENSNIKFLVVEPSKGEYKNVFGGKDGVSVFGTNPKKTPILRMNPFSFPDDVHVLEHIDRLVEIFNSCWPMYAAMPAVLKDAIEQAYKKKGWNLSTSESVTKEYPTFDDLLEIFPEIMEKSAYSNDTRSDYTGSLVTRINSLTNGINGQIFCSNLELTNEQLFDENVIVDISRIGSQETKSLIMGILVMKLQEYRMSQDFGSNQALRHITVLEEAHNLLRKTSNVQSQESSNLQGKSVEMITNAIAEMRTYGEGFIIADQSPSLLDEAVIRNTNTKIILRLPDEADRILVGKAAALNDDQILEIAKLPLGVAVVYQNNWLEAVLCKGKAFENEAKFECNGDKTSKMYNEFFDKVFGIKELYELEKEEPDNIKKWIDNIGYESIKSALQHVYNGEDITDETRRNLAYNLFNGKKVYTKMVECEDDEDAKRNACEYISKKYFLTEPVLLEKILQLILESIKYYSDSEDIKNDIDRYKFMESEQIR